MSSFANNFLIPSGKREKGKDKRHAQTDSVPFYNKMKSFMKDETWTCGHGGEGEGGMNWEIRLDINALPCAK